MQSIQKAASHSVKQTGHAETPERLHHKKEGRRGSGYYRSCSDAKLHWSMGDGFHGMLCRFHFEAGLRDLCSVVALVPALADPALGRLLELEQERHCQLVSLEPQVVLGDFQLVRALQRYAAQAPPKRFLVADMPKPCGLSPQGSREHSLFIHCQLLKCLPFWTDVYGRHPICWCLDSQCLEGLDVLYEAEVWEFLSWKDGVPGASVRHRNRGVSALWSSDVRVVHESSLEFARARPDMLVVRVLHVTCSADRHPAALQRIAEAKCPPNCLSLWIRQEIFSGDPPPELAAQLRLVGHDDMRFCSSCLTEKPAQAFVKPDCLKKGVQVLRCASCMERAAAGVDGRGSAQSSEVEPAWCDCQA